MTDSDRVKIGMREQGQAELVGAIACEIGENPLWHPDVQALFFVDIPAGTALAAVWRLLPP